VFPLRLPPLRERPRDLALVCAVLLGDLARRLGRRAPELTEAALAKLRAHPWLGNLRELSNVLERAMILRADAVFGPEALDLPRAAPCAAPRSAAAEEPEWELLPLHELERRHVLRVLRTTGGKVYGPGGAAAILGLKPSTLQSRMKKLGIARREILPRVGAH
jgi:transcriptional regulator with GAF, ATPase, and Fis domain